MPVSGFPRPATLTRVPERAMPTFFHRAAWLIGAVAIAVFIAADWGGQPDAPLFIESAQRGVTACIPAPDDAAGFTRWDAPVAMAFGMYYNQSGVPLTIESVSLVQPHNLAVHGVQVYKAAHNKNLLGYIWTYDQLFTVKAWRNLALWQRVPDAVIPAESGPISDFSAVNPDIYEVVLEVSQATPKGGWAIGQDVTYKADGHTFTATLLEGMVIGAESKQPSASCTAPERAALQALGLPTDLAG